MKRKRKEMGFAMEGRSAAQVQRVQKVQRVQRVQRVVVGAYELIEGALL